jgi:CsoR family transcriptional regulator, copper-sensing transcriptional repressor
MVFFMSDHGSHKTQLPRLKRVRGQVDGIIRMVEGERYCVDVLTQLRAARAALRRVEQAVLREHAEHCVTGAAKASQPAEAQARLQELFEALERYGD